MSKDTLGSRMKGYENVSRIYLTKRNPVIIRIDGRAFHGFTKGFERPFDGVFMETMTRTAAHLCANITGCKLAYTQSDEISLLITDYDTVETQPWFDNNLQKLVSISASMATLAFNRVFNDKCAELTSRSDGNDAYTAALTRSAKAGALFDARAFILPKEEVCNYFIWRQQDATRNSILMVAQAHFAHKEIQGVSCDRLQDKLFTECGINWNDLPPAQKRGTCIIRRTTIKNGAERRVWTADDNTPIFTKAPEYINDLVYVK